MKIKRINKFLDVFLSKDVIAITLCPFGIYIRTDKPRPTTVNHEKIHWKQQVEMLVLFFYLWYVIEYLIRLLGKSNAYMNICFEREAYANEDDVEYLNKRKPYSWVKYLGKKYRV